MSINYVYPYKSVLSELSDIYKLTGKKPCVGIILFENFSCGNKNYSNNLGDLGKSDSFTQEECEEILKNDCE